MKVKSWTQRTAMEEAEIGMGMWEELKAILDCLGEEVGEDNREKEEPLL